jgi:hypothetical protein
MNIYDKVFQDGVYLELISFTHPASHYPPSSPERHKRESNRWASKSPGWIDYAFLGNSTTSISDIINKRAAEDGSGVEYLPEKKGGRERPDGKVLEWVISSPKSGLEGVPFFCGDITPRKWRVSRLVAASEIKFAMRRAVADTSALQVPVEPPSNTEHPAKALGIAHVHVLADGKAITTLSNQLMSVVGSDPITSTATESVWILETPTEALSGKGGHGGPELILATPKDEDEREALKKRGPGVYEVAFWVDKSRSGGTENTPYGKLVWRPEEA